MVVGVGVSASAGVVASMGVGVVVSVVVRAGAPVGIPGVSVAAGAGGVAPQAERITAAKQNNKKGFI